MAIDWESRYQSGDTPWEKGVQHPTLPLFLRQSPLHGRVLVPGCGSGADVRAIAEAMKADKTGEVFGLDCAPSAVARAHAIPRIGQESYIQGDLFALPAEWEGSFDAVWEHTCFCAIDPASRGDYARAVAKALRTGGILAAIFFLDPGLDPGESGPPYGVTREELDALFTPAFELLRAEPVVATYPGREGGEELRVYRRKKSV